MTDQGKEKAMVPVRAKVVIEDEQPFLPDVNPPAGFDMVCNRPPRWELEFSVGEYEDASPAGTKPYDRGMAIADAARKSVDKAIPRLFAHQRTIMIQVSVALPEGITYHPVLYRAENV